MATDAVNDVAQQRIDLKILTNTSHSLLRYSDLAANTTVGQLKAKIHNELGPPMLPHRMRLIYRGRFLPNDGESLLEVFGADNLKQTREQNLHLVIPDQSRQHTDQSASTPLSRPTSVPPPHARPPIPSIPSHTNPFRAQQQPPPRSSSQPQSEQATTPGAPQPHDQNPYLFGTPINPGSSLPLPPEFANLINQQLAVMQRAQANAQQGPNPEQPVQSPQPQTPHNGSGAGQEQNNQPRWNQPNLFQQVIAQQQQQRAAAVGQGSRPGSATGASQDDGATRSAQSQSYSGSPSSEGAFTDQHRGNPVVNINHREGVTANGAHWISVNHTIRRTQQPQPNAPHLNSGNSRFGFPGGPINPNPWRTLSARPSNDVQAERIRATLVGVRREADSIRTALSMSADRSGTENQNQNITETQLNDLRSRLDALSNYVDQAESFLSLSNSPGSIQSHGLSSTAAPSRNVNPAVAASTDASRSSPVMGGNASSESTRDQTTGLRSASSLPLSQQSFPTSTSYYQTQNGSLPEVHLISGPEGPYALLVSSYGTYTSSTLSNLSLAQPTLSSGQTTIPRGYQPATNSSRVTIPAQPGTAPATNGAPNQPNGADRNAGQANQADPAQAIRQRLEQRLEQLQQRPQNPQGVALAGHVWLAVRLIFFLYMFSSGPGWRRPLMIAGVSLLVWLFQIGVFNTPVDILRQHFEGLLPLPEERRREQQMQRRAVEGGTEDGQQAANPTPEETAHRLVQEREEQNRTWFRDKVRLVERAVALFVASLWPGLGERMVATREARLRQQREEEEQRERDAQAQAEANATQQERTASNEQNAVDGTSGGESAEDYKGKGKEKADDFEQNTASSSSVDNGASSSGELTERGNMQARDW